MATERCTVFWALTSEGDDPKMSASNRSVLQKAYRVILADPSITTSERLKAANKLWRIVASTKKGKPRGRPFPKGTPKNDGGTHRLEDILTTIQ